MGLRGASRGQGVGNSEGNDKGKTKSIQEERSAAALLLPGLHMPGNQGLLGYECVYAWPSTRLALNACLRIRPAWMEGGDRTSMDLPTI